MALQQRIVIFRGNVQGVGFRYTAIRIAENYDVTGYVRNLPNGDVELVAEGDQGHIDLLVEELARRFEGYIRSQAAQIAPIAERSRHSA